MAESNPLSDQNTTPEDVATLYSWANLHGAKYRDFSASRAQTREMARLRAEQAAVEAERQPPQEAESAQTVAVEQTAQDQPALETEAQEKQAQERQIQEKQIEEQRELELRAQEVRAQEERVAELQAAEQRAAEQRASEQRVLEQQVEEQRAAEERAAEQRAEKQRAAEQWAAEQRAEAQRAEDQRAAAKARHEELEAVAAAERARRAEWEQQVAAQMAARQAAEEAAHREAQEAADRAARVEAEQAALKAQQEDAEQAAQAAEERAAALAAEQAAVLVCQQAAEEAANQAAEQTAKLAAEQAAEQAARQAEELAAKEAAIKAAEQAVEQAAAETRRHASLLAAQQAAERAAEHAAQQVAQQRAWQRPADRFPAAPPMPYAPQQPPAQDYASYARAQASGPSTDERPTPSGQATTAGLNGQVTAEAPRPGSAQPNPGSARPNQGQTGQAPFGPGREEWVRPESTASRNPWASAETRETAGRPAWLNTAAEEADSASALPNSALLASTLLNSAPLSAAPSSSVPPAAIQPQAGFPAAPDDTLQGSRDRLTSRWFALRGVFDGNVAPIEPILAPSTSRPPAMAVFSLAGGVGKTSLVATLGRALSARGERVLLVDTAAFGLLPFFFGATDQRPGVLRTFTPPGISTDAPIQMVTLDPEGVVSEMPGRTPAQESLSGEISKFAQGAGRVIVDLATASGATTRRIMRMAPMVLVPVIPDMNSVVSVSSIDAFFEHNGREHNSREHNGAEHNGIQSPKAALPYYVLNQFDASLPLHLDVREVLGEQLGDRLLPFALRRAPAMSEALAEGMTVVDYAPGSPLAEDFNTLAGWVKSLSAPATTTYRGVRWSEK
jgi:cellulose synthase operon protein YhjQ